VLRAVAAQANGRVLAEGVADRALPVVAEGLTNKEIASTLVVGEHTVARHLQTSSRSSECPPVPRPARPPTGLL
jgi:transposase